MERDTLVTVNPEGRARQLEARARLLQSETFGSIIMVIAAVVAIILANSAAYPIYEDLLDFQLGIHINGFLIDDMFIGLTLEEWVNDVLMTLFFLCVGMEVKYEILVGELKDVRAALLPIIAACGGVLMPIIIYSIFNFGGDYAKGFGIPMATDIAFAIGVLSLVGKGIPRGLVVFLKTLAIADDIMAIVVIALFYGQSPDLFWMGMAAIVLVVLILLNVFKIYYLTPYVVLGIVLWFCVFNSGIECTIAGVILAFTIPTKSRINARVFGKWVIAKILEAYDRYVPGQPILAQASYSDTVYSIHEVSRAVEAPLNRLERLISPWSNYFILPIFAFFNAGVRLVGVDMGEVLMDPVVHGVFFGLFLGKPIGIFLASFICIKTGLTPMPSGCQFKHMLGAGMLGGIGFTMAIYVANLSFTGAGADEITMMAKASILCASVASGVVGVIYLKSVLAADRKRGIVIESHPDVEDIIDADIDNLVEISKTAAEDELGEGEHLILSTQLGEVSDEELINAFMQAINAGDELYKSIENK